MSNTAYIPVFDHTGKPNVSRMPSWIRQQWRPSYHVEEGHTAAEQQLKDKNHAK